MVETRYDGGFFIRNGTSNIGGGRMDVACFFMSFLFCCRSLGKRQYCRHRMRIGCDV